MYKNLYTRVKDKKGGCLQGGFVGVNLQLCGYKSIAPYGVDGR